MFGEKAGSILGGGIEALAHGGERFAMHQDRNQHYLKTLADKQKAQDEDLEVNTKLSQLRTDWSNKVLSWKDNPSTDLLTQANQDYDAYATQLIKGASSKNVANELQLHAAQYKMSILGDAHQIQTMARQQQFGASFSQMIANGEDSIFAVKSLDELNSQKQLLNKTIDGAINTGRISNPEIAESLRQHVNNLSVSWAEANVADNPKMVMDAVNGAKGYEGTFNGVPVKTRETLLNKAQNVIDTNDAYDKVALHESLQSDIVQRIKTGQGSSLDMAKYRSTYGDEAAKIAQYELDNATKLHGVTEEVKGASGTKLNQILSAAQPKADPKSNTYAIQQKYADQVQQVVQQADADKRDDAFTYYAQNPALKSLVEDVMRANTSKKGNDTQIDTQAMSDAAIGNLRHAVLELQKMDPSISPDDYKVMPKEDAKRFIEQFNGLVAVGNQTDGAGVRDLLLQFSDRYKDNLPIALNQLSKMKGGEAVTPLLNPLMWHVGNPSVFRLTIDALRKDQGEQLKKLGTEKEIKNFQTDVSLDPNLVAYSNSMTYSDNSPETEKLVGGVKDAYKAFARDYVINGGKMKDASSLFFANYSWGTANGVVYARPVNYTDQTGKQHVMSEEQQRISNKYLDWYPRSIDPSTIDPTTILHQTKYFDSKELTYDVGNALKNNTFWSTTGDETGVYLFTKGAINGAPKQVKDKKGNPIRVNFVDTMKPAEMLGWSEHRGIHGGTPRTDDTWLDSLANMIIEGN